MNDKLISIDDADLDSVAGGLGISVDAGRVGGLGVSLDKDGLKGEITLFGHTIKLGLGLSLSWE